MYTYNLAQCFERIVKENSDKTAIIFCDGCRLTYNKLDQHANQAANYLLKKGIRKQDVVAIQNNKTPLGFIFMIACIKMGAIYTNFDVLNPKDRLRKIFLVANPKLVLADEQISNHVLVLCEELEIPYIDNAGGKLEAEIAKHKSNVDKEIVDGISGRNPVYIMFTSGSTGIPKGVLIKHESVLNLIAWGKETFYLNSDDIMTNANPIYFDNSVFDFYCSVFNGITMLALPGKIVGEPKRMLQIIEENQCTCWFSVPSLLIYLMNIKLLKEGVFSSIRLFAFGGEAYPKELLRKLYTMYSSQAAFYNVYGPTEATCICSAYEIKKKDFEEKESLITLGKMAKNFDYLILDTKEQVTSFGELCLMGTQLALGYYNDSEKTEKAFVRNPIRSEYHQTLYRTGDLVEEKMGKIYFRGRKDNQIKHMGYRIELEEIEAGLIRIPYIKQCAVVHGKINSDFAKIVAFVAVDFEIEEKKLREELREFLPAYMIPGLFIFMKELPKNPNGKVDRKSLKDSLEMK